MKTQEELLHDLERAFLACSEQADVTSWTEFAKYIDIPYPTIYRIVNKKVPLTPKMYRRIIAILESKGIVINNNAPVINAEQINAPIAQTQNGDASAQSTDPRWFDLVAEKDRQIDRLLGII